MYDFTDGCKSGVGAKQINYILIDPECQVSRDKYAYIHLFAPGSDSRTADNYLYQNRKYNGTFAIDHLFVDGCIMNVSALTQTFGVTVDGTATTDYSYDKSSGVITFNTAPGNAKAIVVTY